jgi:hypothetical protein
VCTHVTKVTIASMSTHVTKVTIASVSTLVTKVTNAPLVYEKMAEVFRSADISCLVHY